MSGDARMAYTDLYKEYAKLKTKAYDVVQMVYKVGQQLNQQPTVTVFSTPGAPPSEDGRTLFDPTIWPTSVEIQALLKSWMDAKAGLDKIWETIPESERPGLLPPPTLSLSAKVA